MNFEVSPPKAEKKYLKTISPEAGKLRQGFRLHPMDYDGQIDAINADNG